MKVNKITSIIAGAFLGISLAACEGEKDLIIIDGDLPIKTSTLYMVGDATPNGWSIDSPTEMIPSEDDPLVFTWEGTLNTGEMKLCLTKGSWDVGFIRPLNAGDRIGRAGVVDATFQMHAGDPDEKWVIADAGIYNLVYNLRNWTMSATFLGEAADPALEPIDADALYIVGDATPNGWNIEAPTQLEKKSAYIYVYEGPLTTGEMKACTEVGSWDIDFVRPKKANSPINREGAADGTFVYTAAPDNKWKIEEAGIYRLTFDLEKWTFTAEYTADYKPLAKLYLIGDGTAGGWNWDDATVVEANPDNENIFVWQGQLYTGELKASFERDFSAAFYRPAAPGVTISQNGVSSNNMVLSTDPDDKWMVTHAGAYKLTFDIEAMTFSAEYLGGTSTQPLYMIGTATAGGWSLDDATVFTPVEGVEGQYTWTGHLYAGTFKACHVKDFMAPFYRPWDSTCTVSPEGISDHTMVFTAYPDDQWNVTTEGEYTITINTAEMTINTTFIK